MIYDVCGPFEVPRSGGHLDKSGLVDFWDDVEDWYEEPGLSRAIGIYVYSSRHGDSYTPWYVGKTCAKQGFKGEVFQDHKVQHYLASAEFKRGVPLVHLIPRLTPTTFAFSRPSDAARKDVDTLETMIIGMALRANPNVRNDKKTWFNKNCSVPGIIGPARPGRRSESARSLRSTLKLDAV
jgi:hypothetical protein